MDLLEEEFDAADELVAAEVQPLPLSPGSAIDCVNAYSDHFE